MQEAAKAALEQPLEMEDGEVLSEKASDSDSSDNDFGLNKPAPASSKPAAPKTRVSGKRSQSQKGGPAASEKDPKLEKALSRASTSLAALEDWFSPLSYWQASLKGKDCESKINKAIEAAAALDAYPQDNGATDLSNKLKKVAERVASQVETLDQLSVLRQEGCKAMKEVQTIESVLVSSLAEFPADCMSSVVTDWGKAIIQARWIM